MRHVSAPARSSASRSSSACYTELKLKAGDDDQLHVVEVVNTPTFATIEPANIPECEPRFDTPVEWMTITGGSAIQTGPDVAVHLDFVNNTGTCTLYCRGFPAVTYPGKTIERAIDFKIEEADLGSAGMTVVRDAIWMHAIGITRL